MDNKRAIEVLQKMAEGKSGPSAGYTAIDREDALDAAIAALAPNADRWWATYNAALTGLCALSSVTGDSYTDAGAHNRAVEQADIAHGKLVQP